MYQLIESRYHHFKVNIKRNCKYDVTALDNKSTDTQESQTVLIFHTYNKEMWYKISINEILSVTYLHVHVPE